MAGANTLAAFLSTEETGAFQLQMMQLLSEEILRYNHQKSSSIRVEAAESLLESMLYGVTAYLQTLPDPAAALRARSVRELREAGVALLKSYVEECKALLEEVRAARVPTDLIAYNDTIDRAIDEFFQTYDPEFAAQDTTALIDYPLYRDDMSVTGILYIRNYLTELKRENEFCAKYSKNYIRALLFTHGAKYHIDYRELLINIPELILSAGSGPREDL
jgi:hypothetical protein